MNKVLRLYGLSFLIIFTQAYSSSVKPLDTTKASTKDAASFGVIAKMRSDLRTWAKENPAKRGTVNTAGPDFAYAYTESNKPRPFFMTDKGLALRFDRSKGKIDTLSPWGPINLLNSSKALSEAEEFLLTTVKAELFAQEKDKKTYKVSTESGNPTRIFSVNYPSNDRPEIDLLNTQRVNWDKLEKQASQPKSRTSSPAKR